MRIKNIEEKLLALLVLLPYIEGSLMITVFEIDFADNAYVKAIVTVMIIVTAILTCLNVFYHKHLERRKYTVIFIALLLESFAVLIITTTDFASSICTWFWFSVPIVYALAFKEYCRHRGFNIVEVIKGMTGWFTALVAFSTLYYVVRYDLFFDSSMRIGIRGGGAVILGYTIAVFFALTLCYKRYYKPFTYYLILIVLTVGSLGTGSRGSIWPVVVLWVIEVIFSKISVIKTILIACLIFGIGYLLIEMDLVSMLSSVNLDDSSRIFSTDNAARSDSSTNLILAIQDRSLSESLFGYGSGNFFPYLEWNRLIHNTNNNKIIYNGYSILVQPHNSFLYMWVENGLIGAILLCCPFLYGIVSFIKNRSKNFWAKILVIAVMIFVNCFDSIFFVQAGIAGTYWILLLLMIEEDEQNKEMSIVEYV